MSYLQKRHLVKACNSKYRKRQETEETVEPEENEKSNTDKSIILLTEIKHVTDQKNHITMTIKTGGTKNEFIATRENRSQ